MPHQPPLEINKPVMFTPPSHVPVEDLFLPDFPAEKRPASGTVGTLVQMYGSARWPGYFAVEFVKGEEPTYILPSGLDALTYEDPIAA